MPSDSATPFLIRFEACTLAEAGSHAAALRELLLDAAPGLQAQLERTAGDTMDLGSTLRVGIAPAATDAAARSIASFMARERPGTLVIEHQGRVVYRGDSADAPRIAQALAERSGRGW